MSYILSSQIELILQLFSCNSCFRSVKERGFTVELARREDIRACLDCKVVPGECVVTQHKLVVADFRFRVRVHRDKRAKITRTKWWKLRGEGVNRVRRGLGGCQSRSGNRRGLGRGQEGGGSGSWGGEVCQICVSLISVLTPL